MRKQNQINVTLEKTMTSTYASNLVLFEEPKKRNRHPRDPDKPQDLYLGGYKITSYIAGSNAFESANLFLVDVGASGGIDQRWRAFGSCLQAVGFDPLVKEVDRLNSDEASGKIFYVTATVGCDNYDKLVDPCLTKDKIASKNNKCTATRFSSTRAKKILNHVKPRYQSGREKSEKKIDLDSYFADNLNAVNFLKIDTDGHDYRVLLGAKHLLKRPSLLGLKVEVQFHGACGAHSETFCSIDTLLRENGFTLFDLSLHKCSRTELPGRFVNTAFASTENGQTRWADALYFRDAADADYTKKWGMQFSDVGLLKLVCMFELFSLEDCAAELLITYRKILDRVIDVDRCLDILTPPLNGKQLSYKQYIAAFEKDPKAFLTSFPDTDMQSQLFWARINLAICRDKLRSFALFGAGQHTRRLLADTSVKDAYNIVAIIDDNPPSDKISGIPLRRPKDMKPNEVDAIIVSSDAFHVELANICKKRFADDNIIVIDPYEGIQSYRSGNLPIAYVADKLHDVQTQLLLFWKSEAKQD